MEENYPSLKNRVQSTFIDTILIVILMYVFANILNKFENVPDSVRIAGFLGLWLIYEPFCMAFGCTVGNYLSKIRVRKETDSSKRINILQAILRYIFKLPLGWISFLTIHTNQRRRAIHDFISGSVMIKL